MAPSYLYCKMGTNVHITKGTAPTLHQINDSRVNHIVDYKVSQTVNR